MAENPPYMVRPNVIATTLSKIRDAATPDRFTQDYLAGTLGMKSGNNKPIIPFLKRVGFLAGDGTPSDLYRRYRNPSQSGAAVAEAMRIGYKGIYQKNEKAHELTDSQLKGLILELTGAGKESSTVRYILRSFKALRQFAVFGESEVLDESPQQPLAENRALPLPDNGGRQQGVGLNLGYTINLNLPASSDVNVFNAIFRSIRENLLKP